MNYTLQTQSHPKPASAGTEVAISRAAQEVQASIVAAKHCPRNELTAIDRIKTACQRPGLANAAVYQYAKGGADVSGPSIRLAEALALHWGNIEFGWRYINRTVGEDGVGVSTVEAFAWDKESNVRVPREFPVRHWRDKKNGGGYALTDERDIYELCANMAARRLRACLLAVIPADVVEGALDQCHQTMHANADTDDKAQKAIVTAFAKYGVTREQIEARIQRRLDSIQPANVVALRKVLTSLKDGMSAPSDWFDVPKAAVPAVDPGSMKEAQKALLAPKPEKGDPRVELQKLFDQHGIANAAIDDFLRTAGEGGIKVNESTDLAKVEEGIAADLVASFADIHATMKGGWQ